MDNLTRRLRIYFGPCFTLLGAVLNPEADELSDAERIERVRKLIAGFDDALRSYQQDELCQQANKAGRLIRH